MRLTEYSHGSGWACKLSQGELAQVLKQLQQNNHNNSEILVGLDNANFVATKIIEKKLMCYHVIINMIAVCNTATA